MQKDNVAEFERRSLFLTLFRYLKTDLHIHTRFLQDCAKEMEAPPLLT